MIEVAISLVVAVAGTGAVGVALAWLNDRRLEAAARRNPPPHPKVVLERRLATGEIDENEFNRRMHLLVYGPPLELEPPR